MNYRLSSDQIIAKYLDGEAIVINLNDGMYYSLQSVSACVWHALTTGHTESDVLAAMRHRYPERDDIERSLTEFVTSLCETNLLAKTDITPNDEPAAIEWPDTYEALAMVSYDDVAEMVALDPPLPELEGDRTI